MNQALWGALSMASWAAGLFFFRFWRASRDRLFLYFFLAFWALAVSWLWLILFQAPSESKHYAYLPRFVAFGLIIAGIVDKNRRKPGA